MIAQVSLARRAFAEFLATALLVAAVVGSGIAAQTLSPNDVGLQLLENTIATAAVAGFPPRLFAAAADAGADRWGRGQQQRKSNFPPDFPAVTENEGLSPFQLLEKYEQIILRC